MQKLLSSKVEWDYIEQLIDQIADEKVSNMVRNHICWYVIRSNRYKFYEHILNIFNIITPFLIIIINTIFGGESLLGQIGIAFIGTGASITKMFSALHEKRILYRRAAEKIKNETTLFVTGVGKYSGENQKETFLEEIMAIVDEVNGNWQEIERKAVKSQSTVIDNNNKHT